MTYRSFSLIPALSNRSLSDRFAQMDSLFSRLTGEKPVSENINYNLLEKNKNSYELKISVPGYTQDELDVAVLNNQLTITGTQESSEDQEKNELSNVRWLHKGIVKNGFSLSFNLEHRINIQKAALDKGLLILEFSYEIPEAEKPKKINIEVKDQLPNTFQKTHTK